MIALYEGGYLKGNGNEMDDILEKYKEMEKQQIIDAHLIGLIRSLEMEATKQATEYYNETYGSKGSDKEEQKRLITEIMNEDAKDGLYNTSSQTEISDEEYYKDVFYQKQVMNPYPTGDQSYTAYEKGFMDFAKWYREQVRQRK